MEQTVSLERRGIPLKWPKHHIVRRFLAALEHIPFGRIELILPDGSRHNFGTEGQTVTVEVHRWETFLRILWAQDIGAAETFAAGWWDTSDLPGLCRLLLRADALWNQRSLVKTVLDQLHSISWRLARNTRSGSRRNIARHYDLSNELYRLFLDPTLTYSCALFDPPSLSLEEAQRAKLDFACRQLGLRPGDEVLEIGCGWGSFALHAAQHYGAKVHGISLSARQIELARQRALEAHLSERVRFDLVDYRDVNRTYDHIVSIEMFEAVGHEYYRHFFSTIERCLRPGGRFFLQTITIPDQRYDTYRRQYDFIKKHIFPGGLLASLERILWATKHFTHLRLVFMQDIGQHYARTLHLWRQQFLAHRAEVENLGFDRSFIRMWEFYLASCEAAFAIGHIGDAQMVFQCTT